MSQAVAARVRPSFHLHASSYHLLQGDFNPARNHGWN
jgi:hypothetical protein